jgi:HAD superfamily hydrolase (TIGR01662 family)
VVNGTGATAHTGGDPGLTRSGTLPTTIVVPTLGRPSLQALLDALAASSGPRPRALVLVDDRRDPTADALSPSIARLGIDVDVVRSGGVGPAAARNAGWRRARTPWVSFLDDDVVPASDWYVCLGDDLAAAEDDRAGTVAGSQGMVEVPLPAGRCPTDWERGTAGLANSAWITADMSYRRSWLSRVGGFDERFPRAFREDSDLALRVLAAGGQLVRGQRRILHPVRPADDLASLRQQAGNADDALMRRLHGPMWRERAQAPPGRLPRHATIAAASLAATGAAVLGRPRAAALAAGLALAGLAEFAAARILPGPRDAAEVRRMLITSAAIPYAATWHAARGTWSHRRAAPWTGVPELVLLDRDGTLVHDVPYNGDPALVAPVPGARSAVDRLRAAGIRTGVITNQSAIGSGRLSGEDVAAVNARVEELLGPFDVWEVCPHAADAGCACRKPAPAMVLDACEQLEVDPQRCVVIGDIGSDVGAAEAAGATGVLVPTPRTARSEVVQAREVHGNLTSAVDALLRGTTGAQRSDAQVLR